MQTTPASQERPGTTALPTCAVVICAYTWDRWDDTLRAVASVQAQQPPPHDLILVVDHNSDLQARFVEVLPDVRVVANRHDRGISGARNTGVELTNSDIVAFLDDDAAAEPGWLEGLIRNYADPKVLGVGGRIEPGWSTTRPRWWPPEFDWVVGCTYTGHPTGPVRNLIGASCSFRRELFADGGFVSGIGRSAGIALPVGCEETEFCIRAANAHPDGFFVHDDSFVAVHRVPPARQTFSYFRIRCWAEGLSKALVTDSHGMGQGLSSEWSYSTVILPRGVLRGLSRAARGDIGGLLTAVSIIVGLGYTTVAYAVASMSKRRRGGA